MQRRSAAKARPDIPTSRLDREIVERREDVTQLQEQLNSIESKLETLTTPSSDTTEAQRAVAAVAQSCEACQKGLEQESRIREQVLEDFTAKMHDSMQKATSALQADVAAIVSEVQEMRQFQSTVSKAAHRRDENLGSFKEVVQQAQSSLQAEVTAMVADLRKMKLSQSQLRGASNAAHRREEPVGMKEFVGFKELVEQEIEALKKRASNQWEHFDAMFAQLNEDVAATKSEIGQVSQTFADHDAAIEDIGKLLDACNDRIDALDEKHVTERPASLRSTPRSSPRGSPRGSPCGSPRGSPRGSSPRASPRPQGSAARSALSTVRSDDLRAQNQAEKDARGSATPPHAWSDLDGYDTATETVLSYQELAYGRQYAPNIVWSDTASSLPAVDEMSIVLEECLNAGRSWLK